MPVDDRAGKLQNAFVADLEAADEPARFLNLRTQQGLVRRARNHGGIPLVHTQARGRHGIQLEPAVRRVPDEYVGHEVGRGQGLERRPGPPIAVADERERGLDVETAAGGQSFQVHELLVVGQLEMVMGDYPGRIQARRARLELRELQANALGHGSRADADRVELLDDRKHALHDLGIRTQLSSDSRRNRLGRLGQVTVVVDRADQRVTDRARAIGQRRQCELTREMLVQGSRGLFRPLTLPSGVAPGRVDAATGYRAPTSRRTCRPPRA